MANLKEYCHCGKLLKVIKTIRVANKAFDKTECGHTIIRDVVSEAEQKSIEGEDRMDFSFGLNNELKLMDFQKDGIQAAERNDFKFIFADDTGLGKTFQLFGCLRLNKEKLLPCLIVCKAKLRTQLANEAMRMVGIPPQIMGANYEKPLLFPKAIVVVSYDMIWRMKWDDEIWTKFKTVILDECQQIKNPSSKRSKKVKEAVSHATHVMGASATPAKNHGLELYPILNMVAPQKFPTETGFVLRWLDVYEKGRIRKIGGVRNEKLEDWKEFTRDFMIRRKKHEVLDNLPAVRRSYRNCDLAEEVEAAYQAEMDAYVAAYEEGESNGISFAKYSNLLAYITRMRHLVGLSKIDDTLEEVDEMLLGSNEKVVIFTHHIDVAEIMMRKLIVKCEEGGFAEPVWYKGGLDDARADAVKEAFINSESRVMVASTLAAGEGLDGLQKVCGYAIMHERQWNPANEEQCEGRFSRIGAVKTSVLMKYMIAIGTIDEWFTELVDQKRKHLTSLLDAKPASMDETSLTREMMDLIYQKGRKQWRLN